MVILMKYCPKTLVTPLQSLMAPRYSNAI